MPILILYADLRKSPSVLKKAIIEHQPEMSAKDAVARALGKLEASRVEEDLGVKEEGLLVSWYNVLTNDVPEIGGVGTMSWRIEDFTILTITYGGSLTTPQQESEFEIWTIQSSEDFPPKNAVT